MEAVRQSSQTDCEYTLVSASKFVGAETRVRIPKVIDTQPWNTIQLTGDAVAARSESPHLDNCELLAESFILESYRSGIVLEQCRVILRCRRKLRANFE